MMMGAERDLRSAMVLGCGEIGLGVAQELEQRGLRLKVFEKERERAVEAACVLERSLVLHDTGLAENTLLNEGIRDVDMFVAATGDDRLNMLAALQAKRLGARRTVAVVEEGQFSGILETVGVDVVISPRRLTASAVRDSCERSDQFGPCSTNQRERFWSWWWRRRPHRGCATQRRQVPP